MLAQLRDDDLADLVASAPGSQLGRQLLAPDLEQQFAIHHATPPSPRLQAGGRLPSSTYAFAMPIGELPDAQDVGGALGDADAVARVEHVEQVRALQAVLERRPDQAATRSSASASW